jgi:DNA-binding transcriptional LysR family regulator
MRTNILSLQLFVSVVDEDGVNKAARLHHLVPSAVSKHIAALEEQFHIPLFARVRGRLKLTPAGGVLLYHARRAIASVATLETQMRELREGIARQVVVSCNTSALNLGLADMLEPFSRAAPEVAVTLREGRSEEVVAALHDRSADIGLFSPLAGSDGLHCKPWATTRLAVACHARRALPAGGPIAFEHLLAHDFIVLGDRNEPDALAHLLFEHAARLRGAMKVRMLATSVVGLSALISADVGIAILPECTTAIMARQPNIVSIPLADDWAVLNIHIGVRHDAQLSIAAWSLHAHLLAAMRPAVQPG